MSLTKGLPSECATLTNKDVEYVVHSLKNFPVAQVGSKDFLDMAFNLERLALHAHENVDHQQAVASILRLHDDKAKVLVQNLVAIEVWRTLVMPQAAFETRARCRFVLHAERTILTLLDMVLLQGVLDEDCSIALIDYCARAMVWLVSGSDSQLHEYRCAVFASTSLARHFCESFERLDLDCQSRILDIHDFSLLLVPLLDEPPWTRRRMENGETEWEKWIDDQWKPVPAQDLIQLVCTRVCEHVQVSFDWTLIHTSHNVCTTDSK